MMQKLEENQRTNGTTRAASPNPVRAFEVAAKKIWDSPRSIEEKRAQLSGLGSTITGYIEKVDDLLASKDLDVWVRLSINRSRLYLQQLASDVKMLAATAPAGN